METGETVQLSRALVSPEGRDSAFIAGSSEPSVTLGSGNLTHWLSKLLHSCAHVQMQALTDTLFKIIKIGAGKMAHQLRALVL